MNFQRRRLLQASGLALAGLAGCSGLPDDGRSGGGGQSPTPGGPLDLEFGEGAQFSNDRGVALAVEMSNPRLLETVPVAPDG